MLAEDQLDLTPLQKQVLVQGFQEIKKQEMEAQQQMMGGGKSGGGGPTSGSVRNGAASGGKSGSNKQVEEQSFVNPGATDPLENVDEEA